MFDGEGLMGSFYRGSRSSRGLIVRVLTKVIAFRLHAFRKTGSRQFRVHLTYQPISPPLGVVFRTQVSYRQLPRNVALN